MRFNLSKRRRLREATHEGARAAPLSLEQQLRRSVLACMLWEDEFYEAGETIADRVKRLAHALEPELVARLAIEARRDLRLRHAPLLLLTVLARTGAGRPKLVADTLATVLQRADEPAELLALYWQDGKKPLPAQFKKGLARALAKFDAYALAKYDRPGAVRLRDVLFLVHAKPSGEAQTLSWKQLADGDLASPDTWEVALSAGADKRETFERLLRSGKLGYLALLRNLRNMSEAGVDPGLVKAAILARRGAERVLPFRFVAAARAAPRFDRELDKALRASLAGSAPLAGTTLVLVDVSGSMQAPLSRRSDLSRMDAAAALASIVKGKTRVFTFSEEIREVAARPGLAGIDAVLRSQPAGGTRLGNAVAELNRLPHDRLIVVTDEQSQDEVPAPVARRAYMINVASAKNGVGYGPWTRLDGFSEHVLRWIAASERT